MTFWSRIWEFLSGILSIFNKGSGDDEEVEKDETRSKTEAILTEKEKKKGKNEKIIELDLLIELKKIHKKLSKTDLVVEIRIGNQVVTIDGAFQVLTKNIQNFVDTGASLADQKKILERIVGFWMVLRHGLRKPEVNKDVKKVDGLFSILGHELNDETKLSWRKIQIVMIELESVKQAGGIKTNLRPQVARMSRMLKKRTRKKSRAKVEKKDENLALKVIGISEKEKHLKKKDTGIEIKIKGELDKIQNGRDKLSDVELKVEIKVGNQVTTIGNALKVLTHNIENLINSNSSINANKKTLERMVGFWRVLRQGLTYPFIKKDVKKVDELFEDLGVDLKKEGTLSYQKIQAVMKEYALIYNETASSKKQETVSSKKEPQLVTA